MFENATVGILVLAATFTVGLLIGWRFWGAAAKQAADDRRDLELDVQNERRKGVTFQKQRDDAKAELEQKNKRLAELEAALKNAPVEAPAEDLGALKTALAAAEQAHKDAEKRALAAEALAAEAEKRAGEVESRSRMADTLVRVSGSSKEIEEAKAKREAEMRARAEADAKRKVETVEAEAEAKKKTEEARAKAEAEAKKKAEEAEARAATEAKKKKAAAEAEAKAKAEEDAKKKAEAEAKAKAEAEAKAKAEAGMAVAAMKPADVSDAFWELFGSKVPVAKEGDADDLIGGIKGIGPVTGKRLNQLGIYTYAQVASFDQEILAKVADKLGAVPSKIERDDWVGQAKKLLAGGQGKA